VERKEEDYKGGTGICSEQNREVPTRLSVEGGKDGEEVAWSHEAHVIEPNWDPS
jgi:hypothetical protein